MLVTESGVVNDEVQTPAVLLNPTLIIKYGERNLYKSKCEKIFIRGRHKD
jgi:hypothetical protein